MGRQIDGAMTTRVGDHTVSYGVSRELIDGCPDATIAHGSSVSTWRCMTQPARGKTPDCRQLTATLALSLHVGEHTRAHRPPRCAGDGAGALSVSALSVRL